MLTNSEEHRRVFPEPPIAFRRCKNLKDILVRARLSSEGNGGTDKKGCSRCGKSRCQVCHVIRPKRDPINYNAYLKGVK